MKIQSGVKRANVNKEKLPEYPAPAVGK